MAHEDLTDVDQAWFWTDEWQTGEQEASADIAARRTARFDSDDALLTALGEGLTPPSH